MLCLHCQRRTSNRPRQLCFACYDDLSIRAQYQAKTSYDNRSDQNVPSKVAVPTKAMPGQPDKVEVMAERRARGEPLFCDGDAAPRDGDIPAADVSYRAAGQVHAGADELYKSQRTQHDPPARICHCDANRTWQWTRQRGF